MRTLSTIRSLPAALVLLVALAPAAARADFAPASLLSGTAQLQFGEADSPAFASDGRYVAFRGSLAGVPGIYRRDLQTGEVAPVAVEDAADPAIGAPDATAPSISADGRYVAFTTAAVLDPGEDTGSGCPQVYVRDMDVPAAQAGAYTLASAVNGSATGLTYAAHCAKPPSHELLLAGSQAAPGVALSADGRRVVFTVLGSSNLTTGVGGKPETPGRQVAVRDLDTDQTTLVTATPGGEATPGGGAYPSSESEPDETATIEPSNSKDEPTASSAAISADGTTVAWEGTNVPEQAPPAIDVIKGMPPPEGPAKEVEPLWRRVADGAGATTRRLLNGAGLNFYFFGNTQLDNVGSVLGGAFVTNSEREFVPPALSADGWTVATIANAPTPVGEADYLHDPASDSNRENGIIPPTDAYVARVPRDSAAPVQVQALTATPVFSAQNVRLTGVRAIAISPDGQRVAFNTIRTAFALASPALVSPPAEEVGFAYTYEANLALATMQRVTTTYDGLPPDGEVGLLSFAGDGPSLAFASAASNLFYGDGLPGASEVYLTSEQQVPSLPAPQSIGPVPPAPAPAPEWVLSATVAAQPDGSAILYVRAPGAGRLQARATAQLPAVGASRARGHAGARAAKLRLQTRTVARSAVSVAAPDELRVRLRPSSSYRAKLATVTGLYAVVRVQFSAPAHRTLTAQVPVTLRIVRGHRGDGRATRRRPRRRGAHG